MHREMLTEERSRLIGERRDCLYVIERGPPTRMRDAIIPPLGSVFAFRSLKAGPFLVALRVFFLAGMTCILADELWEALIVFLEHDAGC